MRKIRSDTKARLRLKVAHHVPLEQGNVISLTLTEKYWLDSRIVFLGTAAKLSKRYSLTENIWRVCESTKLESNVPALGISNDLNLVCYVVFCHRGVAVGLLSG